MGFGCNLFDEEVEKGTLRRVGITVEEYEHFMKLKSIEDEYRVDLVALFKALKRGEVWVREHNTKDKELVLEEVTLDLNDGSLRFRHPRPEIGEARNLFDYGKTWANTKEKLAWANTKEELK